MNEKPSKVGVRWKVPDDLQLLWRAWDSEFVVFNCASDDTHVLNLISAEALFILENQAVDAPELARQLASRLDLSPDEELERQIRKLLSELEQLDLIEIEP